MSNQFVVSRTWTDFVPELKIHLWSVWSQWNRDIPIIVQVFLIIGFFIVAFIILIFYLSVLQTVILALVFSLVIGIIYLYKASGVR